MITYVKGDLFSTHCRFIVHGCNNAGVMGSGVAKIVREKYPKAYHEYKKEIDDLGPEFSLGKIIPSLQHDGVTIINAITQGSYGYDKLKYVSYDAVDMAMQKISYNYSTNTPIAMPKIGAGLGGGDWRVIEAIINSRLTLFPITVYHLD